MKKLLWVLIVLNILAIVIVSTNPFLVFGLALTLVPLILTLVAIEWFGVHFR